MNVPKIIMFPLLRRIINTNFKEYYEAAVKLFAYQLNDLELVR